MDYYNESTNHKNEHITNKKSKTYQNMYLTMQFSTKINRKRSETILYHAK